MRHYLKAVVAVAVVGLALCAWDAHAEVDSADLLDAVGVQYRDALITWNESNRAITNAATRLFWALTMISMIWTFGQMVLKNADIGEFFAEFFRFTMFTGFYWWLLMNGPRFATSIIDSMRQLGGEATGLNTTLSPSNIVDVGFAIFDRVVDQSSFWSPANSTAGIILAAVILVVLGLVAINMLIMLIVSWILAYAGAFYLGFGGSKWTSDMAIGYFRTVLNVGTQLFAMVVIVGLGNRFLSDYYARLSQEASIKELAVELIASVVLLALIQKIPPLLGNLASGGGAHGLGAGLGAGSVARGAMGVQSSVQTAGQAISVAGAVAGAGMAGALGGASALIAAVKEGAANTAAGKDIGSAVGGSLASLGTSAQDFLAGGGSGSASSGGGRSLAEQMGMGMQGGTAALAASGASSGGGSAIGTRGGDQSPRQGAGGGVGGTSGGAGASQGGQSGSGKDAKGSGGRSTGTPAGGTSGSGNGQSPGMGGLARDGQGAVVGSTGRGAGTGSAGSGGGVLGTVATGGRITADAAANLGAGVYDFGMEKATNAIAAAKENIGRAIDRTWGGQIAAQIHERGARGRGESGSDESDVFDGNSLSAAASRDTTVDAAAEIAAFRDRG